MALVAIYEKRQKKRDGNEAELKKMTNKQKAFVIEYMKDKNATQAAIRAGYKADNAEVVGCRLVKNSSVSSEIQRLMNKAEEKVLVSIEYVIKGLKGLCEQSDNDVAKVKSYELLGKYLNIFKDADKNEDKNVTVVIKNYSKK